MMTPERLCEHIIYLIHAPIHAYDAGERLKAVYVDNGEQQDILSCDPALVQLLLEKKNQDCPVLHMEANQVLYGIVCSQEETYLMGPCCAVKETALAARSLISTHGLDEKKPYKLPYVSIENFTEMAMMLYETLTENRVSATAIWMKSFSDEEFDHRLRRKIQQVFYYNQEQEAVHNPYSQERREQESIRTGNLEALEASFRETYVGKLGTLSHNKLRNMKDLAIVLVTLASRSAIEGGVLPEIVFSMSDGYIQRIEELGSEGEALALGRQAEREFCCLVRDTAKKGKQHPLVLKCKELVLKHLHTKISVKELAQELDVNANYLSQLFAKNEGMKLGDYIAKEKISYAVQQLLYTEDSFEQIAYSYAFFSQSHFGRVFKKWTGLTPGQYREKYGHFPQK